MPLLDSLFRPIVIIPPPFGRLLGPMAGRMIASELDEEAKWGETWPA